MIKRRFYKLDHGDRDAPSESSSSSDFELEAEATEESESEEEEGGGDENDDEDSLAEIRRGEAASSSSGYESGDSSANEVNLDSSGLPTSDDDGGSRNDRESIRESHLSGEGNVQHKTVPEFGDIPSDVADCVVKRKSVFKCKLCPRIVCLTEDSLRAHLKSKRHGRSEKLLREGRLKLMLEDDGKVDGEADPDNNSSAQISAKPPVIAKRPPMQRKKFKKKKGKDSIMDNARQSAKNSAKKRRRSGN